jgi:putative F0F1-ATPase subunit (Ca2+/Mg2+ transporter)
VKGAAVLVAAGSAFAGGGIAGLLIGIWVDHWQGTQYYAVAGLFAGVALGGYAAFRMLLQQTNES